MTKKITVVVLLQCLFLDIEILVHKMIALAYKIKSDNKFHHKLIKLQTNCLFVCSRVIQSHHNKMFVKLD
jgi:hypothetical protein